MWTTIKTISKKNKKKYKNLKISCINLQAIPITVMAELKEQRFKQTEIPLIETARHSSKKNYCIHSYAANTHQGNIRTYNEDRVSIILNILRPECKKLEANWPDVSFFGIYDGHGGNKCADFLRDQLHQIVFFQNLDHQG